MSSRRLLWSSFYVHLVTAMVSLSVQSDHRGRFRRATKEVVDIEVLLDRSNASVDILFLSVALPHMIHKWNTFTFHDAKTRQLCRLLRPASVRVLCNPIFASPSTPTTSQPAQEDQGGAPRLTTNQDMSVEVWGKLYEFVKSVGWRLSMDFTNLNRRPDNQINDDNTKAFLDYAERNHIPIPDFQLGNEPNLYEVNYGIKNITPEVTVRDFLHFRELVRSYPSYRNSTISGPDVTHPTTVRRYLPPFFKYGGCDVVDEVSFHHYYMNLLSSKPVYRDFINTTVMEHLRLQIFLGQQMLKGNNCSKPLRITETSSVSGGLGGVADRYIAGFLWLDKLGVASLQGITRLYRFNVWGSSYSLLNRQTLKPNPDYFLSVLHKRLVEGPVLEVLGNPPYLRVYANCAKAAAYNAGAIVIYLLNVRDSPVTVSLKQFADRKVDTFFFTPGTDGDLLSRSVKVSGVMMTYNGEGDLIFKPIPATGREIHIQAYSFGYVLVSEAGAAICRQPPHAARTTGSSDRCCGSEGTALTWIAVMWLIISCLN